MTEEKRILIVAHPKWHDRMSAHMTLVQVKVKDVLCSYCGQSIAQGSIALRNVWRGQPHYFHCACGRKCLRIRSGLPDLIGKHRHRQMF